MQLNIATNYVWYELILLQLFKLDSEYWKCYDMKKYQVCKADFFTLKGSGASSSRISKI